MKEFGWGEVDKPQGGGGKDPRFLALEDGDVATVRCLDDQPKNFATHSINSVNEEGESIFRSIPATQNPDDDYIDANSRMFPAKPRHALRVLLIAMDGEELDNPEIKCLVSGNMIFGKLKKLMGRYGDITGFDVDIARDGEGIKTEYDVTAAPNSEDIDVEEWVESMDADDDFSWDRLLPPFSADDQRKVIEQAGIDLDWDPIAEAREEMTYKQALKKKFGFGKYGPNSFPPKGKTIREVLTIDAGYLTWLAGSEFRGDDYEFRAAVEIVVEGTGAIDSGESQKAVTSGKKKTTKKKSPPPPPEPEEDDEEEDEDEGEEVPTRKQWKKDYSKLTVENYLNRWGDKNGKHVAVAIAILASEGVVWPPEEEEPDEPEEEEDDDIEEDDDDSGDDDDDDDVIADYVERAKAKFGADERFDDAMEIVKVVKKASGGRTVKLRELTLDEHRKLDKLLTPELSGKKGKKSPKKGKK